MLKCTMFIIAYTKGEVDLSSFFSTLKMFPEVMAMQWEGEEENGSLWQLFGLAMLNEVL